jgi:hypothetical protein
MRSLITILLLATLGGKAQQIGQNAVPGNNDTPTLSVRSQIVIEIVVVKDKKGNTIDGLTTKDFILTETACRRPFHSANPSPYRQLSAAFL